MKRLVVVLYWIAFVAISFAQSSSSDFFRRWMIADINIGNFNLATHEIIHVTNWNFDVKTEDDYLDLDMALKYKDYLDSIQISTMLQDSFSIYTSKISDSYATYYYQCEEYLQAIKYGELSCQLKKEYLYEYAKSLNNLAVIYERIGDIEMAESYAKKALQIFSTNDEKLIDCIASLHNLGIIYYDKANYSAAEQCYLSALQIINEKYKTNIPSYNGLLICLGNLYARMKNNDKAEYFYLLALENYKEQYNENYNSNSVAAINGLANLYRNRGEYKKSEQYYLQAIDMQKSLFGENNIEYVGYLQNLSRLQFLDMNDYTKAENNIKLACEILKHKYIESLSYLNEEQRNKFFDRIYKYFTTYYQYAALYYPQNPSISTFAYNNELFIKRLMSRSMNVIRNSIFESGDTTLIKTWNKFEQEKYTIIALEKKISSTDSSIIVHQKLANTLEKQINLLSTEYRDNSWNISWDSIQKKLSRQQVAIEFIPIWWERDSVTYNALILHHDSKYPLLIPLFKEADICQHLDLYIENGLDYSQTYSYNQFGKVLSNLIWGNILPYIQTGDTVYFAPAGILHHLAIESLPYDSTITISDNYNMVRLSSTREVLANNDSKNIESATIYGGIQYNLSTDELLVESQNYDEHTLLANRSISIDTLNRGSVKYLPGTKSEAENIYKMLTTNNVSSTLFTSSAANEESFKSLSGKHCNIIHIATHGFYWTKGIAQSKEFILQRMVSMDENQLHKHIIDPLDRCGLLFAGANTALSGHSEELPEGVQDGILTGKEISLMDLRDCELLVLSACESGTGEISADGLSGLYNAFKMAGVQTIIMSLWPVNDNATQMLMTEFYNNWIEKGQTKREAFKNAQNAVRYAVDKDGERMYEEPVYWAGFIMLD